MGWSTTRARPWRWGTRRLLSAYLLLTTYDILITTYYSVRATGYLGDEVRGGVEVSPTAHYLLLSVYDWLPWR